MMRLDNERRRAAWPSRDNTLLVSLSSSDISPCRSWVHRVEKSPHDAQGYQADGAYQEHNEHNPNSRADSRLLCVGNRAGHATGQVPSAVLAHDCDVLNVLGTERT